MKKVILTLTLVLSVFLLVSCKVSDTKYKDIREVKWEGNELTVSVGENQSSGCEWDVKLENYDIVDYSIHSKFVLDAMTGKAVGTLERGFKGVAEGTANIHFTTPVDWDGNEPGYNLVVVVTVDKDGNIVDAVFEEGTEEETTEAATEEPKEEVAAEPELSDEEQIREAFEAYKKDNYDREFIRDIVISEWFTEDVFGEAANYDIEGFVDAYYNKFSVELDDVTIDGDTATGKNTLSLVLLDDAFFEEMNKEFEVAEEEKYANVDKASIDQKEYMQFMLDFIAEYINTHDVEIQSGDFKTVYEKANGVWSFVGEAE